MIKANFKKHDNFYSFILLLNDESLTKLINFDGEKEYKIHVTFYYFTIIGS